MKNLLSKWNKSRPSQGTRHVVPTCTRRHNTTADFPQNGQLYAAICTTPETSHCTTERNASEECHIPLDSHSECSISEVQVTAGRSIRNSLEYFDRNLPVTVQADASSEGIGAALLQQGQPIDFASKHLSDTEKIFKH